MLSVGAEAAVYIIDEQSNPIGLIIKSSPANSGTLYTSSTAAATINSYQFAYWTLNGVRQADVTGRATNPVKFVPTSDSTLEAVYKLATLDSDGDGLLDVFELEFFGTLFESKASDGDADGFDAALEQLLGFHPGMWDRISEGGLSRRSSVTLPVLLNPGFYQVTATSDPPGFIEPVVQFANGSAQNVTLPTATASVNGYNFSGWYVGSVRAEAPTALQPVVVSVSGETTFTAKYVLSTTDSDLDGLLDWFEWFAFTNLGSDALSDPDADLISTLFEQVLGFTPYLKDAVVEGGLSRRASLVVDINLSGQFSLILQSDPPGMQPSSLVWGVPNSVVETPDILNANVNGYRFTGWYVDGQRLTDSTGASAGKGSVLLSSNKTATALFVLDTVDTDADGIADWIEKFYTGALSSDRFTDVEGDLLNFALEVLVGFHPMLVDKVSEGGISRRGWGPSATDYVILKWRPVIEVQPVPVSVAAGAAFSLSVSVTSFAAETYQWQKDGVDIPGATTASYSVASATGVHSGAYRVVVTNAYGVATSNAASVSVGGIVVISMQPVALLAANLGGLATFSVSASGTGPFSYQWRKNGVAVAGAMAATYSIAAVQSGDVAKYDVVVSNVHGSATSSEGSLVLNTPVTISAQPVGVALSRGDAVTFSVSAAGTAPLGYQWRKGGVAIPGAQTAQYTVASAQSYDEGSYDVVVTNPAGSVTSLGALLSVNSPPVIDTHPSPRTVNAGSSATLGVKATGTAPLLYQWRKTGVAVAGGTQATYTIGSAQASDAGSYDVVVTNTMGVATSFPVPLLVNVAPTILSQPTSVAVLSGTLLSLGVVATGTAPLTYQWRKGGTPLVGAIYPTFSLGSARVTDAGVYDVVVANAAGSVTSGTAVLTVSAVPSISVQPVGTNVRTGSLAAFSVTAAGTAPLLYQWRKNSTAISGGTSSILSIASVGSIDAGTYDVVITNAAGSVTSSAAILTVSQPVSITSQPLGGIVNPGTSRTFSVSATGTSPITYQWRKEGVPIFGATNSSLTFSNVQAADAGSYDVVLTNPVGSTISNAAILAMAAPVIEARGVTFAQRTDDSKLVDIRYTLTGGTTSVALCVSFDGGTSFTSVKTLTGDVGSAVSAGTAKHIVWNAGVDYPNLYAPSVKVRVIPLLDGAGGSFAPIPSGTYQMGNLTGDTDITNAGTVAVTLSPYHMAVATTTKAQWDSVRTWAAANGYTDLPPGEGKAADHPVQRVSWYDALKWVNAASEMEGLTPCYKLGATMLRTGSSDSVSCDWSANGYRLPTEAEWEIAARGGLSGKRFPWGDTVDHSHANYKASHGFAYDLSASVNDHHPAYKKDAAPYTNPAGSFAANGYGLYDMAGNVWQWCWDRFEAPYAGGVDPRGGMSGWFRVFRGGVWYYHASIARIAGRYGDQPEFGNNSLGFRLARTRTSGAGGWTDSAAGMVDTMSRH
jgi:formylglycine-generating enzyme required for sulfatase activity